MKTIISTEFQSKPSKALVIEKPKSVPNTKPLLNLEDLPNGEELKKFKPIGAFNPHEAVDLKNVINKSASDKETILQQEKRILEKIHHELEDIRLNLVDSSGQGFLMNASAIISSYIRNNYR